MTIDELRRKIDELDARLVELLNERAKCAHEIGKLKRGEHLPIYEPQRERDVFANVRSQNRGPLPDVDLIGVYERIIDMMRKIQREESGAASPAPVDYSTEAPETEPND